MGGLLTAHFLWMFLFNGFRFSQPMKLTINIINKGVNHRVWKFWGFHVTSLVGKIQEQIKK